ncbi:tRNA (guanine-N7-)-methyltransferase subunit Trm82 [Pseudohyphozyma bogoriensis]|nr:tRNA (guanine-N7-)-methyltransferase subunit Trm82 [Pseudohyphozyma bogoriensis]
MSARELHPHQTLLATPEYLVTASHTTISVYSLATSTLVASSTSHTGLIRILAVTKDSKHLVSTGEDKLLVVSELPSLKELSKRELIKRANAVALTDKDEIVIGDKFGDVYTYPLTPLPPADPPTKPLPILGHVSMLNALLLLPTSAASPRPLIATGDSDAHVRLSRFPSGHIIDKYLWGAKKFVASFALIEDGERKVLVSAGGDKELWLHDLEKGELVGQVEVEDDVLKTVVVAPSAPDAVVKTKGKGKGQDKGKKKEEEGATVEGEGEAVAEGEGEEKIEVDEKNEEEKEEEKKQRVFTLGPHAFKDGVTTGLAVIKTLVIPGQGVVVLAAGATALLFVPLSVLLPSATSPFSSKSLINLPAPILDVVASPDFASLLVTLDVSRAKEPTASIRKIAVKEGTFELLDVAEGSLDDVVSKAGVPLSGSLKLPNVASLYPVLSLLRHDPTEGEDDSGPAPAPDAEGDAKESEAKPNPKKRGASEEGQAQKLTKKGKRVEGREKLQTLLEQQEAEKKAAGVDK